MFILIRGKVDILKMEKKSDILKKAFNKKKMQMKFSSSAQTIQKELI